MGERFTTRPELRGTFGMVASTHWLASAAGMRMLERGGNAFDAAVAAALVLQVVEPHMNGPGGDLSLLFWAQELGEARVLCGQGVAPAAATIEAFGSLGLAEVPGTGFLAACVPGAFGAWLTLLRDFGRLSLSEVFEPAIEYAGGGFPAVPQICETIAGMERAFQEHWPTSAAQYLNPGPPKAYAQIRNRPLAETFRRIVSQAERRPGGREAQIDGALDAFYRGFVAERMIEFSRHTPVLDSSAAAHAGLLTAEDLAAWQPSYEPPVRLDYRGLTVCKTGPWGQGPVFLQQLALLDGFDLQAAGLGSPDYIHLITEAAKLAFADREAWYGDPRFFEVPIEALLSSSYAALRRALISDRASLELRPGRPDGRTPRLPERRDGAAASGGGEPTLATGADEPTRSSGDTCYLAVVDREGNFVSGTPSGGWLQSSPVIPELGFPLGTRAQMFNLQAGTAAALAPGKRPRTTLSPTLVLRDGRPLLVFGTPGGDQQDQWPLSFLLAHVEFGLDLQAAIDWPAFHSEHFPSSFYPHEERPGELHAEERVGPTAIKALRDRGHRVVVESPWSLGRLAAVARDEDGVLKAAANPRGMQGYAVGR